MRNTSLLRHQLWVNVKETIHVHSISFRIPISVSLVLLLLCRRRQRPTTHLRRYRLRRYRKSTGTSCRGARSRDEDKMARIKEGYRTGR
ncbi:hypothetical protein I352_03227 [Cryptococcus deuterogattii MMRL2647]|nr:hypothetical protein I352_03227 [Cryptococcus deuterogattii MMRL2647]